MAKKGNEQIQKAAKLILESNKTALKECEATAKTLVKLMEKADSAKEVQEAMKVVESLKKKMSSAYDSQLRVLKVTLDQVSKSEKAG